MQTRRLDLVLELTDMKLIEHPDRQRVLKLGLCQVIPEMQLLRFHGCLIDPRGIIPAAWTIVLPVETVGVYADAIALLPGDVVPVNRGSVVFVRIVLRLRRDGDAEDGEGDLQHRSAARLRA